MARTTELVLDRKIVKYKGEVYYNYFVACEVDGHVSEARIIPKDNGGYKVLDKLFKKANGKPVTLLRTETKNTNLSGQSTVTLSYTAIYSESPKSPIYEASVKPYRPSDENWIKFFINEKFVANSVEDDDEEFDEELAKAGLVSSDETQNDTKSGLLVSDESKKVKNENQ